LPRVIRQFSNRRDEAIAALGQRFDVVRRFGLIAQRRADLLDAEVQALLKIYECLATPDLLLDFFSGDQLARMAGQQAEDLERLRLQFDLADLLDANNNLVGTYHMPFSVTLTPVQ